MNLAAGDSRDTGGRKREKLACAPERKARALSRFSGWGYGGVAVMPTVGLQGVAQRARAPRLAPSYLDPTCRDPSPTFRCLPRVPQNLLLAVVRIDRLSSRK